MMLELPTEPLNKVFVPAHRLLVIHDVVPSIYSQVVGVKLKSAYHQGGGYFWQENVRGYLYNDDGVGGVGCGGADGGGGAVGQRNVGALGTVGHAHPDDVPVPAVAAPVPPVAKGKGLVKGKGKVNGPAFKGKGKGKGLKGRIYYKSKGKGRK